MGSGDAGAHASSVARAAASLTLVGLGLLLVGLLT